MEILFSLGFGLLLGLIVGVVVTLNGVATLLKKDGIKVDTGKLYYEKLESEPKRRK